MITSCGWWPMAKRQIIDDIDDGPELDEMVCATGPGRRKRTTGALPELYADDNKIHRHCNGCGAEPLQFCHWPNGTERRAPCGGR
ncbi:hypothetical protein B1R94_26055 [Mycolicibacterium litorale]|nr:hypothetical protein B1R94_26055 [Mycolicibacterium litorale]